MIYQGRCVNGAENSESEMNLAKAAIPKTASAPETPLLRQI